MIEVNLTNYKIYLERDLKNFRFFESTEILLKTLKPVSG
jgi:hypothetical protein